MASKKTIPIVKSGEPRPAGVSLFCTTFLVFNNAPSEGEPTWTRHVGSENALAAMSKLYSQGCTDLSLWGEIPVEIKTEVKIKR